MTVTELPTEMGDAVLIPKTYDIVMVGGLVLWLVVAGAVAYVERRRGASLVDAFLWFVLTLVLPVMGLAIWGLYRVVVSRGRSTRT